MNLSPLKAEFTPSFEGGVNSALRDGFFAVSGCRFYCRFWLPLLVAVSQGEILARYNIAGLEPIEELRDSGIQRLRDSGI
jgi:hypothetical protein